MSTKLRSEEKNNFPWVEYEQILKDIILRNGEYTLKEANFVEISKEMRESYKVEDVTADNVRWKVRTPNFKQWLKKQEKGGKTSNTKKRKRKEKESSESLESDDSSYSSDDDEDSEEEEEDLENMRVEKSSAFSTNRSFSSQPVFWIVSDSNYWWYFMLRKWKIEAQHVAGKQYMEIQYKIDPPSVFDIQKLYKTSKQESLKTLDIRNTNIQNQIKGWKPITWKVALATPLPLVPSLYKAAREDDFSWIQVPKNNSRRSTAFGDEEVDVDFVVDFNFDSNNSTSS